MANILFKRGLQASLPTTAQDGVFYLTTDTNRLYVGQGSTMALLNQTVQIVANVDSLPKNATKNDFYYCTAENVLAVWDGTKWQQINKNTNDNIDTYVTGVSKSEVVSSEENGIVVSFNIKQTKYDLISGDSTAVADIPVSFTISKEHLDTANEIDVGLLASAITGGAKISTTGNGADSDTIINIKAGDNVSVDVSKEDITISAIDTTYDIGAANNKIVLTNLESGDTSDVINLASGNDALTVVGANDTITVTHKEYSTTGTTSTADPAHKTGTFTVIDSITTDKGHVTGYNTKTVTLPEDLNTTNTAIDVSVSGADITVSISDSDGDTLTKTASDALYYTVNGTKVSNQGEIEFYTKEEIDTKLNTVDAMHYCGTVGGTGATVAQLPSEGVKVGDTYKTAAAGTYAGVDAEMGDLFIATGTEEKGVITSNLQWTYIPSGDDIDTKYSVSAANNKVVLKSSVSGDDDSAVEFTAGSTLEVSTVDGKINYKHANVECTPETSAESIDAEGSFTVIDSINVNDQGHVTGYNTKTVTLPADTTSEISLVANHKIQLAESNGDTSSVSLANDDYITLTDTTTGSNGVITVGHKQYDELSATTGAAKTLDYNGKFTVVTGVTRDAGGHLSGYTTTEMTMPVDTNEVFTLSGDAVSAASNVATITTSLTGDKGNNSSATMKIAATADDNLQVTGSGNQVSISMVWGEF